MSAVAAICADIERPGFGAIFDHAMANPPWHDGSSTKSPDAKRALAHHARPALLASWIKGLTACLKPRGSLTLILPAASFGAAAAGLHAQGYGSVQLFPLWPRAGQPAKLVIIAARLGSRAPDRVLPGLVLHDAGGITAAAQAILQDGAATALAR
jgi:tRNA1(Val) A37 N6-methylase TrmN6